MNLHGIAGPVIAAVNPMTPARLQVSNGVTIQPDGTEIPRYLAPSITVNAQVQPISTADLRQLEGVNLGGVRWKAYLFGAVNSIVRPEKKGGDLLTLYTGRHKGVWLVVQVLEQFPDWCCAAIVQQNGS